MSGRSAAVILRQPEKVPTPIDVLELRASSRALLWATSEIETIPEAVDPLQSFAVESGLVVEIGQDAVQKILRDAFAPYREVQSALDRVFESHVDESFGVFWGRLNDPQRRLIPKSTIDAFRCVVKQHNPKHLRNWLARRRPDELAVFKTMLTPK